MDPTPVADGHALSAILPGDTPAEDRGASGGRMIHRQDLALARLALEGNPMAQTRLVDEVTPAVLGSLKHRGLKPEESEDLCQEVLLHLFKSLPSYRGESRLTTWAWGIARRRFADWCRSPKRREHPAGHPEDEDHGFGTPAVSPDCPADHLELSARKQRVHGALTRMAEPARSVLVAFYLLEQSVAEIAAGLEMPPATVKTHLHRGRKALRGLLTEEVS